MLNTFIFNLMLQFELADLLFQLLNHCPSNKRWSKMTRWMFCGLTKTLNLLCSQNCPGDTLQYHYCGLHFPWCSRLTLSGPHPPESSAGWSEDWAPARVWPTSPCTHPPTAPRSPCLSTFHNWSFCVCVSLLSFKSPSWSHRRCPWGCPPPPSACWCTHPWSSRPSS